MKKRMIAALLLTLLLSFSAMCAAAPVIGGWNHLPEKRIGVGNQNSYSGGGSGGSSGGYSGGYSGGGSGGIVFFGGSGGSGSGSGAVGIVIAVVVIIAIVAINQAKKSGAQSAGRAGQQPYTPPSMDRPAVSPAEQLKKTDPDFSEQAFLAWAHEVFIQLNTAWTKQDWAMIRPFESDALFREHSMQLDEYKRNGTVNYLERVAVKDSFIESYSQDEQYEYLVVKMRTSMIDYVMETATGKITAGDRTTLWQMIHTLTFMRKLGVKTRVEENGMHTDNCPNCGAPTKVDTAGVCEYCGSQITSGSFNWMLCKFTGENI